MDPVGAIASGITVLGALITSIDRAYSVINGLRQAPEHVQALSQEIIELKAVFIDVKAASELQLKSRQASTSTQPTEPGQPTLSDQLSRAQTIVDSLSDLVSDLILSQDSLENALKRLGWIKNRKKIDKLRNHLKSMKINIAMLLMTKTVSYLSNLDSELVQIESRHTRRHDEVMFFLSRLMRGQSYTAYRMDPTPQDLVRNGNPVSVLKTTAVHSSQASTPSPVPGPNLSLNQRSRSNLTRELVPLNSSAKKSLIKNNMQTPKVRKIVCTCYCHRLRYHCSPIIASEVFGRLIVGVSGHVFSEPVCNEPDCIDQWRYSATVAYYFPSWLLAKVILISYFNLPCGNPSVCLKMRNLLPEHSPMMLAIAEGHLGVLQSILQERISSPNDMEAMGWTALTWAIHTNRIEICDFLLRAGADPSLQDGFGNSAFDFAWLAVFERQLKPETLAYLRDRMIRDNDEASEDYGLSVLHRLILGLDSGDLSIELANAPYGVINRPDHFGKTPLLWAARRGDLTAVKALLCNGADPNISDSMRRSPLHMAARSRSVPVIRALIKYGADPHAVNFLNEMPAHYACYEQNSSRLLEPFLDAHVSINLPSKFGRTMLDIAVQWNHPILVDYLLRHGAKIQGSVTSDWRHTPLGRAVLYKTKDVLSILLDRWGEPTFIDDNGDNVLHFLAKYADRDTIGVFKNIRIDACYADAVNQDRASPIDLVRLRGDDEFVDIFIITLDFIRHFAQSSEVKKSA